MESVRVDKWIWTVRLSKSRTVATKYCKENKVKINTLVAKPSSHVKPGDTIEIAKQGFNFLFTVNKLLKSRVSATLAQPCYDNITPEEELNKYKSWFIGKAGAERRQKGDGRPTKKERREIDEYKINSFLLDDDFDE